MVKPEDLESINAQLTQLDAAGIVQWAVENVSGLFQTSALGLSGLVILDMLSKILPKENDKQKVDLIFIDTLHHFKETLDLLEEVKTKYPQTEVHVYKPEGCATEQEFAAKNGDKLWETNELLYDYLVKVEPADRAFKELGVKAVFTGRRRSQGGSRAELQPVDITEDGMVKINPLYNWSFEDVRAYMKSNGVPSNALLSQGYRSVGDYHSTEPVKEGEDERAGRWKGKAKTECGIHDTKRFADLRS